MQISLRDKGFVFCFNKTMQFAVFALLILLPNFFLTQAHGQLAEGFQFFSGGPPPRPSVQYSERHDGSDTSEVFNRFSQRDRRASALLPLIKTDTLQINSHVRAQQITLPEGISHFDKPGQRISRLDSYQFSLQGNATQPDQKVIGGSAQIGSASDQPFHDESVLGVNLTAFWAQTPSTTDRWIYILNYSNNRSFLNQVPLPGFVYEYFPSPTFRGFFGFPFIAFHWKPTSKTTVSGGTLLPWNWRAQIDHQLWGPFQIFSGFDWSQELFFLAERERKLERLYMDSKRASLGIKGPLSSVLYAELRTGYAFDRWVYLADRFERARTDSLRFNNAIFASFNLSARF